MHRMIGSLTGIWVMITGAAAAAYLQSRNGILLSVAITFGTIAYHFIIRLLIGAVVGHFMKNRADYHAGWFQQKEFEKTLYKKLNVKHWKGKMPTYDPACFSFEEHTPEEIVQAMCQSEIVHEVIVPFSFLPLVTVPEFGAFPVFFITSFLAAGFDLSFVMIQRFNRPRIVKIMEWQH